MRRILIPVVFLLCFSGLLTAATPKRNAGQVRKERQEAKKKIDRTRRQIKNTVEETQREFNRLSSIEADIKIHASRIAVLQKRSDSLTAQAKLLADTVEINSRKVERLKNSYSASLRAVRRQRQLANATAYIFSSSSFREAYRRMRYLRELGDWQHRSAATLAETVKELSEQKTRLDSANAVLSASLDTLKARRIAMESDRREANSIVASLKRQSKNLNKVLEREQQRARRLDEELNRIIEEEAQAAAEAARRKAREEAQKKKMGSEEAPEKEKAAPEKETAAKPQKDAPSQRPAAIAPGTPFARCKGKLPMPLDKPAKIVSSFGRSTHSEYSKVVIQNNGIDFETQPGANALAVHEGTVSMIIVMEGYGNVVLVRHGEYLTVYAGLSDLRVRKGEHVKAGQIIGTVFSDPTDDGRTRLHFEVRREKEKLNPSEWLR